MPFIRLRKLTGNEGRERSAMMSECHLDIMTQQFCAVWKEVDLGPIAAKPLKSLR